MIENSLIDNSVGQRSRHTRMLAASLMLIATLLLSVAVVWVVVPGGLGGGRAALMVLALTASALTALLVEPACELRHLLYSAVAVSLVCAGIGLVAELFSWEAAAAIAMGTMVLTLFYSGLFRAFGTILQKEGYAELALLCFIAFSIATPLVFGAAAELWAHLPIFVNTVVAFSPASYLAALLDYDYLREPWFYQRSSLGALRFDYPDAVFTSVCYLVLAFTLIIANRGSVDSARRQPFERERQ